MSSLDGGTAALRGLASSWSLSGDKQLLDLLQNIHQRIIEKCKETKSKFEEMDSALNNASVTLQNVNNKFMALSNTQFIESRVYDDDEVAVEPDQTKQPTEVASEAERPTSKIARGLRALFDAHESVRIMDDSDSDTDSDDNRTVLRPRDMYSHRPLPYIIGSQAWKSKWHVGLVAEESDSDSSASLKQENRQTEQYSDSGPETADEQPDSYPRERVESTYSSDTQSEDETIPPQLGANPSDVAAELARRLGGNITEIHTPEPETETHQPVLRKIYKPEKPTPGNIFFDEPPPLDSNTDVESSAEENDIFAELHNNAPYKQPNRVQNVTEDLFKDLKNAQAKINSGENVFSENIVSDNDFNSDFEKNNSDVAKKYVESDVKEVSKDIGDDKPTVKENKKPIGGVSLFGTDTGVDTIGAAILKRNRRLSNSSDDDLRDYIKDKHTPPRDTNTENVEAIKAQTEIFDRLFEKSEKFNKNKAAKKENVEKLETKTEEKKNIKVDLFSDNLFDDIDDIFSSVPTVSTTERDKLNNHPGNSQSYKKTLFDDGEDIFADIAEVKTDRNKNNKENKVEENKRGLFDSDDDLFDEKSDMKPTVKRSTVPDKKPDENKTSKGLFDESEDELFANVKDTKASTVKGKENTTSEIKTAIVTNITSKEKDFVVKNDDINTFESDDLFSNAEKPDVIKANSEIESREHRLTTNVRNVKQKPSESPSLFDDDDEDDLFKTAIKNTETSSLRTTKIISDHESLIITNKRSIENEIHEHNKYSISTVNKQTTIEDSNIDENVKLKSADNVVGDVDEKNLFTDSESNIINETNDLKIEAHDFNKNFNTKPKFVEPKLSQKLFEDDDDDGELFRNDSRDNKSLNVIVSSPSDRIFQDEVDDLFKVRKTDATTASKLVDPEQSDNILKDNDYLFDNTGRSDPLGDTKTKLEKDPYQSSKIKSKSPDVFDDKNDLFDKIPENSTNASNILDNILSTEIATKIVNPKLLGDIFKGNDYPESDSSKKTPDSKDKEDKKDAKEIIKDGDPQVLKIENIKSENVETSSKFIEPKTLDKIFHGDENEDMFKMSSEKNEGINSEGGTCIEDYFNAESKVESKSLDKIFKHEEDGDLFKKTVNDDKNVETIERQEKYSNISFKTNETKVLDNVFDDENDDLFKITSENNSAKIKTHISKAKSEIIDESTTNVPKFDSKSPKKLKIFDDADDDYLFSNKVETDVAIEIGTTSDTIDIVQQGADVNTTFTQTINTEQENDSYANIKETSPKQTSLDTEVLYDNIFADQPPEFEKPKEPKKSKNVNALFDDDSDDETLFFKRNDTPFDDKPRKISSELTPSEAHTVLGLFGDEPPAIDFDNPDNDNNRLDISDPLAEQYSRIIFTEVKQNITVDTQTFDQEKSLKTPEFKEKDITDDTRNKKISTNIDINVKALLPGASPKKLLDKGTKTKIDVLNEDSKDTKTFEGTDSTILDNTLSKERAKIPIRRRPSTRRARRDAATKSGIGFEDDLEKEFSGNVPEDSSKNVISKPGKSVTSKTVYILNDEDIFSDVKLPTKDDLESSTVSSKTVTAVDENPLFNITESSIQTLGQVYKNPKIEKVTIQIGTSKLEKPVVDEAKKSLFELSDDEGELFGAKKKMAREKSKSIFDSDSGDELFGGKK